MLKRIFREPLLHFFILGISLFVVFSWVSDERMGAPDEIVIDVARIASLESEFQRVWQRPPTPDEMSGLVASWMRDEVYFREGMAMGLDRNDPVLRRRVVQKMQFISEDLTESPPTEDELRAFFDVNAADYQLDARVSFKQIYFDPTVHGASFESVLTQALDSVADGKIVDGDTISLPAAMDDASLREVRRRFGDQFADSLAELSAGDWVGPIASAYGMHLVLIERMQEARLPSLSEVRVAVERDSRTDLTRQRNEDLYEILRSRYSFTFEDGITLADERENPNLIQ